MQGDLVQGQTVVQVQNGQGLGGFELVTKEAVEKTKGADPRLPVPRRGDTVQEGIRVVGGGLGAPATAPQ